MAKILLTLGASCILLSAIGCSGGDVDPDAPVDAPGYYNGPMKSRGANAGGSEGGQPGAAGGSKPAPASGGQ